MATPEDQSKIDVIVTSVYGRYHRYVARWLNHIRQTGYAGRIHVISLDGKAVRTKDPLVEVEVQSRDGLEWGSGDYVRLERIIEHCEAGLCCAQIDIDTFFYADPSRLARLPYPFIISRGFEMPADVAAEWGFALCTGIYIAKPSSAGMLMRFRKWAKGRSGLDQEDLNRWLFEDGVDWKHAALAGLREATGVRDALTVSSDGAICVLPHAAVSRGLHSHQHVAIHHRDMLAEHGGIVARLSAAPVLAAKEFVRRSRKKLA